MIRTPAEPFLPIDSDYLLQFWIQNIDDELNVVRFSSLRVYSVHTFESNSYAMAFVAELSSFAY